MKKKGSEIIKGDVITMRPSACMGWELKASPQTITVREVRKEFSSGGCRVTIFAEGIDKPFAYLRGSTVIKIG